MLLGNRGIAFKLAFYVSLSSVSVFLLVFGFYYDFSRRLVRRNAERSATALTLDTVNHIEAILRSVQRVPETLARVLAQTSPDERALLGLLKAAVESNPEIYSCCVAFEPYAFDKSREYFGPCYFRRQGKTVLDWLGPRYRYRSWDWYQVPKELGKADWSEPYTDLGGGGVIMATYTVPLYRGGRFVGVATADISLGWLRAIVSSIPLLDSGYGFLISKNGTFVTHPEKDLVMNETVFSAAEARADPELRRIGREMIRGGTGFVASPSISSGRPSWMFYAPIPAAGWSTGVVLPRAELMADLSRLNRVVILLGLLGLLCLLAAAIAQARSLTRPLSAMARAAGRIASGDLEEALPAARSQDEVGGLTRAFEAMRVSLKDHIRRLTEATAARERLESELQIAHDIQMSMLPKSFPSRPEFDLHALLEPAREVGGDLYDFFPLDADRFCFVIGDVAGKGVPAALFMAMTKTLIKAVAAQGLPPHEVLGRVNAELVKGNDKSMFVTLFLCVLDARTGLVDYADGGHNLPFLVGPDGAIAPVAQVTGPAVGVLEHARFSPGSLRLRRGDLLFLYTDGVTEAMDESGAMLSEERLALRLQALRELPLPELLNRLRDEVGAFSNGQQTDDLAMLAVKYNGPE